jgi:hypothetical protein
MLRPLADRLAPRAGRARERGSVTIAVIVALVGSIATVSLLGAVYAALSSARIDQDRVNAFQYANAGVDHALYRVDAHDLPASASGSYWPTVTFGQVTGFTDSLTVGASTFEIVASEDVTGNPSSWTVRSTGTDASGRRRQVIASLKSVPLFPQPFMVTTNFSLSGNQSSPRWFRSSQCPSIATSVGACELALPVPARLGANGTVSGSGVAHFASEWQGFMMHGYASQQAANNACDECPPAQVAFETNAFTPSLPSPPADVQPCPSGGNIGTSIIQPGDYRCPSLNITGTLTVGVGGNGTGTVRFWIPTGGSGLSIRGVVNPGHRPAAVQFFEPPNANGSAQSGSICDSTVWALLVTPGLSIACTGSHQPEIYGAVLAHDYGGTGDHFGFHWDADASEVSDGKYVVQNWRECPPGSASC